jgi:hypothetical protein
MTSPTNSAPSQNARLHELLQAWARNQSPELHRRIAEELLQGDGVLLLTSINEPGTGAGTAPTDGDQLRLTCVFDVDGLRTLAAFTAEVPLRAWTGGPSDYIALPTAEVMSFCQQQHIGRLILDYNTPGMFVLERQLSDIRTEIIEQDLQVQWGQLSPPLPADFTARLQERCRRVSVVAEVYQFAMMRGERFSFVLGFHLDTYSPEARQAALATVQDTMSPNELPHPLDIIMLEEADWLSTVREFEGALLYQRK